ncbi:MAG: hypothetical protein ACJ71R_04915 [Nitrososphaeraceae archaeon]
MRTSIISKTEINTIDNAADYDNAPIKVSVVNAQKSPPKEL